MLKVLLFCIFLFFLQVDLFTTLIVLILFIYFSFIRATMLESALSNLADCELLHPECGQGASKVIINRLVPLRVEEIAKLHGELCSYGTIETFYVDSRLTTSGIKCEVTYSYVTQAYLAMIMTDGLYFHRGILSSRMEPSAKNVDIINDARACMILLSQCYFPK